MNDRMRDTLINGLDQKKDIVELVINHYKRLEADATSYALELAEKTVKEGNNPDYPNMFNDAVRTKEGLSKKINEFNEIKKRIDKQFDIYNNYLSDASYFQSKIIGLAKDSDEYKRYADSVNDASSKATKVAIGIDSFYNQIITDEGVYSNMPNTVLINKGKQKLSLEALREEELKDKKNIGDDNNAVDHDHGVDLDPVVEPQMEQVVEPEPVPISSVQKKPKLSWKTAVAIASGIAVGTTVNFVTAGMGNIFAAGAAGLVNSQISKLRGREEAKRLNGIADSIKMKITSVEDAPKSLKEKVKNKINKVKVYFKSEEGLRDVAYFLNSVMASSMVLSATNMIKNAVSDLKIPDDGSKIVDNPIPKSKPLETVASHNTGTYDTIYKTANDALLGQNGVAPSQQWFGDGDVVKSIKDGIAEFGQVMPDGKWQTSGFGPANGLEVGDFVSAAARNVR